MKLLTYYPTTLLLVALAITLYLIIGPAVNAHSFQTFPELLIGVVRHGSWQHLALNCLLTLVGGLLTERNLGPVLTACLVSAAAVVGLLAELVFGGPGFVGMSGIAYALVAYGLIETSRPDLRNVNALLIALVLLAEFFLLRTDLSVYTHMSAALIGGGCSMFSSLFNKTKNTGPQLRPMLANHEARVVDLIGQTDEDDAEEAERVFQNYGYEDMYVLIDRGEILGVTGFHFDQVVPDLAWLSWTYLKPDAAGQGLGSQMLDEVLGILAGKGARKVFAETSDYEEDGHKVYGAAHRLYEKFDGKAELTLPDYHGPGEAKIIYGINNPEAEAASHFKVGENTGIKITGLDKAPESENVGGLAWDEIPDGIAGLDLYVGKLRDGDYSMGLISLPQDLSESNGEQLEARGFHLHGQLEDYYGTDQSQDWWIYKLNED